MKISELLSKVVMKPVPRSHNIDLLGWWGGYMVVKFLGRQDRYIYGADVPAEEETKILRNPYPDALFGKTVKAKFKCHKVPNG